MYKPSGINNPNKSENPLRALYEESLEIDRPRRMAALFYTMQ